MVPWIELATATAPQGGLLRLMRRGDEVSIRLGDGNELMNSRLGGSEEALAIVALGRLVPSPVPRVLIGGLGMGFTLRAALAVLPSGAHVTVAEIVPDLIDWARGPMEQVFDGCLSDPRVALRTGDVGAMIGADAAAWDAILLDVDNGPDGLTRAGNGALYDARGLAASHLALRAGGILGVWSAAPDRTFAARLAGCGFDVEERSVRAGHGGRGARHTIWAAARRELP